MSAQFVTLGDFADSEMTENDHFWPKTAKYGPFRGLSWPLLGKKVQKIKKAVKCGLRHQTNDLLAPFGDMDDARGGGRSRAEQNRFFQNWWFS